MRGTRRLAALVALTIAAAGVFALPPAADAKARVSAAYGVVGKRTVYATAEVTGAKRRTKVLLETAQGSRKGRKIVRQARKLKRGRAKLHWKYRKRTKRLIVRVRVVRPRAGRKPRTLATGRFKVLRLDGLKRAAPVAAVPSRAVVTAPAPGTPGDLVLRKRSGVNAGDIVAIGFGPATPEGLLAKATKVRRAGSQIVVSTQPATLPEAVPVGELDLALPAEEARTATASPFQRLAKALECTNQRQAEARGEASVSAGLNVTTAWRRPKRFSLPKLTARFEGDVRANLNAGVSISGEAECHMDRQPLFPAPIKLHTFATSIGPVPIVGVVDGQIYLSGQANASGKIESSVKASAGASAGVEYDGSGFKPFGKLDKSFTAQPPTVTASGSIQANLAPAVNVRFYGVGGPEMDFSGGLKLAADIHPAPGEPWWKVTAPLDLGVKLRLNAFTLNLESPRFSVWNEEPELLRATTPAGGSSVTDLGLSPEPLPPGVRTRLTWDSTSDVDLHTWDTDGNHAYFVELDGIPSGYLDQDVIPGYGPETFQETDPGHTYTFGVCQYSGTQANVTVDVRDLDGQTRRFAVTLRGRKAASLLTVSPVGGEVYLPVDTWCNHDGVDPGAIGETTTGGFDEKASLERPAEARAKLRD